MVGSSRKADSLENDDNYSFTFQFYFIVFDYNQNIITSFTIVSQLAFTAPTLMVRLC